MKIEKTIPPLKHILALPTCTISVLHPFLSDFFQTEQIVSCQHNFSYRNSIVGKLVTGKYNIPKIVFSSKFFDFLRTCF